MSRSPLSLFLASLLGLSCGTTVTMTNDTVVASEISVANGRNPVLFVSRNPEDGEWIFLTDERSSREVVVYASFHDLLAMDSSLNQVKDLGIGWQARRTAKGAPWVREPFLSTTQVSGNELSQRTPDPRPSKSLPIRHSRYSINVSWHDERSNQDRRVSVEETSVSVWLVEGDESPVQTLLWSDSLASSVQASIDSTVERCGIDTLKERYVDPVSAGNTTFIIFIWDAKKGESIGTRLKNCWVPSLFEVCSRINALLPERYAMNILMSEHTER